MSQMQIFLIFLKFIGPSRCDSSLNVSSAPPLCASVNKPNTAPHTDGTILAVPFNPAASQGRRTQSLWGRWLRHWQQQHWQLRWLYLTPLSLLSLTAADILTGFSAAGRAISNTNEAHIRMTTFSLLWLDVSHDCCLQRSGWLLQLLSFGCTVVTTQRALMVENFTNISE